MDRACIEAAVTEAILGRRRVRLTLHPRTAEVSGMATLPTEGYPTRVIGDSFGLITDSGRIDYTLDEPSEWDPAVVAVEVLP